MMILSIFILYVPAKDRPSIDKRGVSHGEETENKIPGGQEIQPHEVSHQTRRRSIANARPDGTRPEVHGTAQSRQGKDSDTRKEADCQATLDEDTGKTRRRREDPSHSRSAREAVGKPIYPYLAVS